MPIYEYQCTACNHRFEVRQGFHDPPGAECPGCQASANRVISPVGVVFKGSGWYSTDHRGSSRPGGNGDKPSEAKESSDVAKETEATAPAPATADRPESS